jgi:signal transduction histidine kinase
VVSCDRTRLYQVFSNLIGNALDYMGPVPSPEIRIEVSTHADEHRIVVRDNGRGIEPGHSERIFELYQTGRPRSDGGRGTGIGLAIVKKIAQSQGGRVWVESRPGEGAAFHLVLPRR